ncbi:uncharacterized protein LOC108048582 isoform X2 [Drosophila rhopaloa]|uniref:Uncharacterized protein LOC108048582 isoform X2 n=1 Tax=Drosophila rhopaloa TaxID=1041015 RepID=A0A6P4F339_DRORH|nr:uncharacterized protein LOC108048582 isoform X2 [Drosophila rhopaloa]
MSKYIVFFGLLLILHELQRLESQINDSLRKLEEIKLNNADIMELDRLRTNLLQKEEMLKVCENNLKLQEGSSAFWNTVKDLVQPKLEEKLKTFNTETVVPNITTWDLLKNTTLLKDTIKNNWKDIPRQIVIYFTENEKP